MSLGGNHLYRFGNFSLRSIVPVFVSLHLGLCVTHKIITLGILFLEKRPRPLLLKAKNNIGFFLPNGLAILK
jgi:hypothetical protein